MNYLPYKRDKLTRPPWGYMPSGDDPYLLIPIPNQLKTLDEAFIMLDRGASLRKVAAWISNTCGVEISQTTLQRFYERDPSREEARRKRDSLISNHSQENILRRRRKLTDEQKELRKLNRLKSNVTKKQKKLLKLRESQAEDKAKLDSTWKPKEETKLTIEPAVKQEVSQVQIVPNPGPQTEFLAAAEKEVLYGGAAGGGKSFALNIDPLRTVHLPAHRAITFRKSNDDLRELIGMTKELYPKLIPGAKFLEQKSTWTFPSGGTHWFRYLDRDDDVLSMQGQSFTWAGFDEVTQWASPFVYDYIHSRVRTTDPNIRPYLSIRASANPGGPGAWWVKKRFIDPSPPNTSFVATNLDGNELRYPEGHSKAGQPLYYRRFIPAKLQDNPYLFTDGSYEAGLLSLPEIQRRQLLEGDWDVCEGAAFTEFNRKVHVCAPFDIPSHWVRFRAADWGYIQPGCVLWFACDPNGNLYVYREFYHSKKLTPKSSQAPDVADKILELESGENIRYGVLDVSTWNQRGSGDTGPSIAETMIKRGCMWRPSDRHKNSRKFGKMEIHRRLQVKMLPDEITGQIVHKPGLTIFNTCINLIRTLPVIPQDKTNPEDVDTDSEDHAYDALRYGCMSRPMTNMDRMYRPHVPDFTPQIQYNSFGFPT